MLKQSLHLMVCGVFLMVASVCLTTFSYAAGGGGPASGTTQTVEFGEYKIDYKWDSTYYPHDEGGNKPSTKGAYANVAYAAEEQKFTITAVSSRHYNEGILWWSTEYYAQGVQTACTITNNGNNATLKVSYISSGVDGIASEDTVHLKDGESFTAFVLADTFWNNPDTVPREGTLTITGIEALNSYEIRLHPSGHGSYQYSVGDASGSIAKGGESVTQTVQSGTPLMLTAEMDSSYADTYAFYGWVANGSRIGTELTLQMDSIDSVYDILPVFLPKEILQSEGPYLVNTTRYYFWKDAIQAARMGGGSVILVENYTMPTTLEENALTAASSGLVEGKDGELVYIVPSGVTFVIPYNADNSTGTSDFSTATGANNAGTAYRTLTVPEKQTIQVRGTFNVNGMTAPGNGGQPTNVVNGGYGKLVLDGTLDIVSGAKLYTRGYVVASDHLTHDNNSKLGHVEVASGGEVHMPLQVMDFRGGSASLAAKNNVFPVSNYYFQNIMVSATYQSGAKLYGQYCFVVSSQQLTGETLILAQDGDAMFLNSSGSVTTNYQYAGDKLIVNIEGVVSVNRIVITLKVNIYITTIDYTMDTSKNIIPINNLVINVENGGTMTSDKPLKFLPGTGINVQKGGVFNNNGNLYLYGGDSFDKSWYYSGSNGRPRLKVDGIIENGGKVVEEDDAKITIAGSMNVAKNVIIWQSKGKSDKSTNGNLTGIVGNIVDNSGGTITFNTLPEVNSTTSIYELDNVSDQGGVKNSDWKPAAGLLAGFSTSATDYQQFVNSGAGTYYAKDLLNNPNNAAWYQYTISVQDGKPGLAAVDPSTNFDNAYTTTDTIIGYSVKNGSFCVNAPGRKAENVKLTVDGTAITPDADGVYTVSNITGNKTIVFAFRVAEQTSAPDVWYETLREAINAYDGTGYIKMIDASTEPGFTIDKAVYLDLNGKTVTLTSPLTASGEYFLYGMDSSVTDYTSTPKGKLTCSGETVSTITESSPTGEYYVAIPNEDGSVSFHRYNIYVSGYRFELDGDYKDANGEEHSLGALIFQATLKGNDAVAGYMSECTVNESGKVVAPFGFTLNNINLSGTKTGENSSWNAATKQFEAYWRGYVTKDNIATDHTAQAWVTFKDEKTKQSVAVKLSYLEALLNAADENNTAGINAFLTKLGRTEQVPVTTTN